jgi:Cu2+-containing amine oxidase
LLVVCIANYLHKATEQEEKQADKILKKVEQQKSDIKSQIDSVVCHLAKYYQYISLGTYNALLSFFNITAEEIKGERNGEPVHRLVYVALDENGNKVSNSFKVSLFGKDAGIAQLQKHFEQSKEKMKTNPARLVLKTIVEFAIHGNLAHNHNFSVFWCIFLR